jgi:hypothetical protein
MCDKSEADGYDDAKLRRRGGKKKIICSLGEKRGGKERK